MDGVRFHPLVARWFRERFAQPTPPQRAGWPAIAAGRDTLIAAPTGAGKTLAAFLVCIDDLIQRGASDASALERGIDVLYVSPLKALSNDVARNLETPLSELAALAASEGTALPAIRIAVRTGDTPAAERAKMRKTPPNILVTTPESLFILLSAEGSRAALANVRTVIVDEIHALAGDKRGAHLSLSLERLDRLITAVGGARPTRIGLSATQSPIERIARLLVGHHRDLPLVVDTGCARHIDVAIEMTDDELGPIASSEQCGRVYDRIAELVRAHDTTLVFVNTRRLVERVAHALEERLGEDQVVAHHGSLSRKLRFAAEQKLKAGAVRCAVATASLELGIDVGSVDLVVQLGSPRSIATLLQRIGRSGHSLGKTPKGRLFALTRDQLVECAALVRAIGKRRLDEIELRRWPRDILAQQIVAIAACEEIGEDELFALVRGAAQYGDLPRAELDALVTMLSDGISTLRGRRGAHLHRDRVGDRLLGRRGARLAAITCGGAIPDIANYPVITYPEETPVGSLDEDFAIESSPGDIFLLGNTSWRIRRVEADRVLVEDAHGAPPTIPFWVGEAPARTRELSEEVSDLRSEIEARLDRGESIETISLWVALEARMPEEAALQLTRYLAASRQALGGLPTRRRIIAERFFDEAGGMQLVIHSPLGGRINKAWGLALRKRFCRGFNFELQAAATDDGLILSLGPPHSFPLDTVFQFLRSASAGTILEQAVLGAPVFGVRWRWNSTRALAVLRRTGGKKVPPHLLRMRTDDLLSVVFPMQQACLENVVGDIEIPDHPLVHETMDDCLGEFMDADGFLALLADIESGAIEVVARDTTEPSPLSHEIISANPYAFLDDVPLEERRTRAVALPRGLAVDDQQRIVDAEAIAAVEAEIAPPVRDPDELHDLLLSVGLVVPRAEWNRYFEALRAAGRAAEWQVGARPGCWFATERLALVRAALPDGCARPPVIELDGDKVPPERERAIAVILRGHLELCGPRRVAELSANLGLAEDDVNAALLALEAEGAIFRGHFRGGDAVEWVDRRVLARLHRLTLGRLRKSVEPVDAAALMRFLFQWQRLAPSLQAIGEPGLLSVLEQLQGFESAAGAWEQELLPQRLCGYRPEWLDHLCLSGRIAWARLSPRSADGNRLAAPTRAAPLTLCLREDLDWLRAPRSGELDVAVDSLPEAVQRVHSVLADRGACFLPDLVRLTALRADEVEDALWQLVCLGAVSADGFASLRLLVDGRRRTKASRFDRDGSVQRARSARWQRVVGRARQHDSVRPAHGAHSVPSAAGRWSLLPQVSTESLDPELSARQLLCRYGVVFRDLLVRESNMPPWREVLDVLRRLEARGEVRGGRFVAGFVGEQFALPAAVEGLRAARRANPMAPQLIRVAATDPLNLVGITSPGAKVPAVLGNAILYRDGVPIATVIAGALELRGPLREGESVGADLSYQAPPASAPEQIGLPW